MDLVGTSVGVPATAAGQKGHDGPETLAACPASRGRSFLHECLRGSLEVQLVAVEGRHYVIVLVRKYRNT
jgi:hypothetical protein